MDEEIANVDSCREIEIVLRGEKKKKEKRDIAAIQVAGIEMCHSMRCECGMMVQCSEVLPINGLSRWNIRKTRIMV